MPCAMHPHPPLPRSVAKNQGIRFVFQDGSRIIFRLRCAARWAGCWAPRAPAWAALPCTPYCSARTSPAWIESC